MVIWDFFFKRYANSSSNALVMDVKMGISFFQNQSSQFYNFFSNLKQNETGKFFFEFLQDQFLDYCHSKIIVKHQNQLFLDDLDVHFIAYRK